MLNYDIAATFDKEVCRLFNQNLKVQKFILGHERKRLCLENLEKEIRLMMLNPNVNFDKEDFDYLVTSFAYTFSHAALRLKEEEALSFLEKEKRKKEAKEAQEIKDMFESEDHSSIKTISLDLISITTSF